MGGGEIGIEDLDRAVKIDPQLSVAYFKRRNAHLDLGELDPRDAVAYFNRSLAHERLGHRAHAQRDRTRALELNPRLGQGASR
jgi:tetratricopeptide (TPR) repeat protein